VTKKLKMEKELALATNGILGIYTQ